MEQNGASVQDEVASDPSGMSQRADEDHMGPSCSTFQEEVPTTALSSDYLYGTVVPFSGHQSTTHEFSHTPNKAKLMEMMAQLKADVKNTTSYKELAWQWECTFNSQVEAVNQAYAALVKNFKENEDKQADL